MTQNAQGTQMAKDAAQVAGETQVAKAQQAQQAAQDTQDGVVSLAQVANAQGGLAALVAAAVAQGAQKAGKPKAARTAHKGYGVFVSTEGHMVCVRYDARGRELQAWWILAADGTWAMAMRRKQDCLTWLDAQGKGEGDVAAQKAGAAKAHGSAAAAQKAAHVARAEILAHAARAK